MRKGREDSQAGRGRRHPATGGRGRTVRRQGHRTGPLPAELLLPGDVVRRHGIPAQERYPRRDLVLSPAQDGTAVRQPHICRDHQQHNRPYSSRDTELEEPSYGARVSYITR